ncbi:MAG: hypothetical protein K8I30_17595, partial [Anaerolineae bacterium]|nr:hypothetical protein [Anaerolineae bacterium]
EGTGGINTVLAQYWADVETAGSTGGCGQAIPTIPEDYVLPQTEIAAPQELKLAVDTINTGLALARLGWNEFTQACRNSNLGASLQNGLQRTQAVSSALDGARALLNALP